MLNNLFLISLLSLLFASCDSSIRIKKRAQIPNPATPAPTQPLVTLGCTDPAATNFDSNATQDNGSCTYPGSITQACVIADGTGSEVSNDGGVSWGQCNVVSCNLTFIQVANSCVPANQNRSCAVPNGVGTQSSNDGGQFWTMCVTVGCNATYTQVGGSCVQSNQNQSCVVANGVGSQTSSDGGQNWGACGVVSCNASYMQVGSSCVQTNQSQSCAITNGTGTQSSTDGGVTFGACAVASCSPTYTQVGNSCVLANQNQSCVIANGVGSQSSTNGGQTWGTCTVASCNATYTQVGNSCILSSQNRACSITNGVGNEASTDGGQTWGTCTVASCNATYTQVANSCVLTNQNQSCSITNGTGSQASTDGGVTWGTCTVASCNATFTQVGNTCMQTNQTQSCAITNGTGTQSSTDGGVTFGACAVASCNASYTQVSNTCELTNQSRACTTQPSNSTSGTEASTDGGVTWGACTAFTCDNNYSLVSGACQANPSTPFLKISTGTNFSCGITAAGAAYCWGGNYVGQVGDNSITQRTTPVAVNTAGVLSGKTIKSISVGDANPCVIASDNLAYCWGYGQEGALGNGINADSRVPVAVSRAGVLSGKTIKQLSTGYGYTCAVASDDLAYCWGYNNEGQIGNLTKVDSNIPVAVSTAGVLSGKKILSVMAGHDHSCALADNNRIYCWGKNDVGQLGNGSFTSSVSPVAVSNTGVLSGKTIKSISSYMSKSTCALTTEDKVYCWGNNDSAQLGNGLYANSNVPVAVNLSGVLSGKTIVSVSVGRRSACVRDTLNDLYCWGNNASGTLGVGNTSIHPGPVLVLGNISFEDYSVGNGHVCGIADSSVYCWGTNSSGELGNGTTTQETQPVEISGGLAF